MPYLDRPLQNMLRLALVLSLITALATLFSCGGAGGELNLGSDGNGDTMLEGSLGSIDSILDEVDATLGDTQLLPAGSCIHAFDCVAGASVLNRVYADCVYDIDTNLPSGASINGTSKISFNNQAACFAYRDSTAITDGTTVTKSFASFSALDKGRNQTFAISSASPLSATFLTNQWTVTLPEITRSSANLTYRLKTATSSTLTFAGSRKLGTRQLSNGKLTLTDASDANAVKTYSMSLSFLQWKSATCCLPSFGAIEVTDDATSLKTTYTFDGAVCNQFKKTTADGTVVTLTVQTGCE